MFFKCSTAASLPRVNLLSYLQLKYPPSPISHPLSPIPSPLSLSSPSSPIFYLIISYLSSLILYPLSPNQPSLILTIPTIPAIPHPPSPTPFIQQNHYQQLNLQHTAPFLVRPNIFRLLPFLTLSFSIYSSKCILHLTTKMNARFKLFFKDDSIS